MQRLEFETFRIPTDTPDRLNDALGRGGAVAVVGRPGTGRTSAVNDAVNGHPALHLSFGDLSSRSVRALRQAHEQADAPLLETYVARGLEAALRLLDQAVGGQLVVVDDAEALLRSVHDPGSWADVVPGMAHPADVAWFEWLRSRRGPTVFVGDRAPESLPTIAHTLRPAAGHEWPIKLRFAEGGQRDWPAMARKLAGRLDLFDYARFVAPLMDAATFNECVNTLDRDELLSHFGAVFRSSAGSLVGALDLAHTLGPSPEGVVRGALHDDSLFTQLLTRGLLVRAGRQDNRGLLHPHPALTRYGATQPLSAAVCARVARAMVRTVNDPRSLDTTDAAVVLAAHDLAVRAGDPDLALRTSRLHTFGLIELARGLSQADEFDRAWHLFDRIEGLLPDDPTFARARSYVLNYRAYNGCKSGRLDPATAMLDVHRAVQLWPENARWHSQRIRLLYQLGRPEDARTAVEVAETVVAPHPQRGRHLRVYPALAALDSGYVQSALDLVFTDTEAWADDPEGPRQVAWLLRRLEEGVFIHELTGDGRQLVFLRSEKLTVRQGPRWVASLPQLEASTVDTTPQRAILALVARVAEDLRSLIATPTPWLTDAAASRKSALLSHVDPLNSTIGLDFASHRWFVGAIEAGALHASDRRLDGPVPLAAEVTPARHQEALRREGTPGPGLWFGRAPVDRGGVPTGPIIQLAPAGSGRTADELREALRALQATDT